MDSPAWYNSTRPTYMMPKDLNVPPIVRLLMKTAKTIEIGAIKWNNQDLSK